MKKGFVLMETIVVISVLSVIMIMLYVSYSNILINANKQSLYDNTEYIYKTEVVRSILEDKIPESSYSGIYYEYCRNLSTSVKNCYENTTSDVETSLFKMMGVEAVYITEWNISRYDISVFENLEATTQKYIKYLDTTNEGGHRIIVMFKSENNDSFIDEYQYATLSFGIRR